jgi:hypothetical protein
MQEETTAVSYKIDQEFLFMKNDSFFNYSDVDVFIPETKGNFIISFLTSFVLVLQFM